MALLLPVRRNAKRMLAYRCCGTWYFRVRALGHLLAAHAYSEHDAQVVLGQSLAAFHARPFEPHRCGTCNALLVAHPRCPRCDALTHGAEVGPDPCAWCQALLARPADHARTYARLLQSALAWPIPDRIPD